MLNRVIVSIDGLDYTVVSEEDVSHIRECASLVDQQVKEIKGATPFSSMTATVLAAMNLAGKYRREQKSCDDLRAQVRDYAEECAKLRAELAKRK